jgi:hypothetical protein
MLLLEIVRGMSSARVDAGPVFAIGTRHVRANRDNIRGLQDEDSKTIVSVSGRLVGSATHEFLRACPSTKSEFVLDLTGLRSADSEGIEAIRELVRAGRKLRGVSPFIRLLLDDQPSAE